MFNSIVSAGKYASKIHTLLAPMYTSLVSLSLAEGRLNLNGWGPDMSVPDTGATQ